MINFTGSISIKGPKAREKEKQEIRDALKKEPALCKQIYESDADLIFNVKDSNIREIESNIGLPLYIKTVKRTLEMALEYCNETTEPFTEKIYIKGPKAREKEKQEIRDALKSLPDLVENINNSDAEVTFYVKGDRNIGIKSNTEMPLCGPADFEKTKSFVERALNRVLLYCNETTETYIA